jgi:hypothetical protein
VFSLGVILFQLLTGAKPFPMQEGQSDNYARELLSYFHWRMTLTDADVPRLPALDPALESILRKALRADPKRRQPDARVLGEDLRRYERTGQGVTEVEEERTVMVVSGHVLGPVADQIATGRHRARPDPESRYDGEALGGAGKSSSFRLFREEAEDTSVERGPEGFSSARASQPGLREGLSTQPDAAFDRARSGAIAELDAPTEVSAVVDIAVEPTELAPVPAERAVVPPAQSRASRSRKPRRKGPSPSIFDQDTRKVNVAEILPDEVKDPRGRRG